MSLIPTLRRLTCLLTLGLAATQVAAAQSQHDNTDPTGWWWIDNGSLQDVIDRTNLGYRLVDIEVHGSSNDRYSASFVRNTGSYAKGYWWYVNQTASQVSTALANNNARLIDIEPRETPNGVRYASIMIPNTGADAISSGWYTGISQSTLDALVAGNPSRRLIALEPYTEGGNERYSGIWVSNTGTFASNWWYLRNATTANIDSVLTQNSARLIDLERHPSGTTYSAVMVPSDGKSTWHIFNLTGDQVTHYAEQFAGRVVDIERRAVLFGERFDMVVRQNDNDLAILANNRMRANLPLGASSGLLLKRIDSSSSTLAGVKESSTFEPAGLITTAYHLAAMSRVDNGVQSLSSPITVNTGVNGTCPTGTNPTQRSLGDVLQRMMSADSTVDAWALQASYGSGLIQNISTSVGASGIDINHIIGCLCGSTPNEARLVDFAAIHEAVASGFLGTFEGDFNSLMRNEVEFAPGSSNTNDSANSLLNQSSLDTFDKVNFKQLLQVSHKAGSTTCLGPTDAHNAVGVYAKVPFKSGCDLVYREYFLGAWVNEGTGSNPAAEAVGDGLDTLWRDVISDAIASWESASCNPFSTYCQAANNSTGFSGLIAGSGPVQALNSTPLVVTGNRLPPGALCLLICGNDTSFIQGPGGSSGNLCVGGSIGRFQNGVQAATASGAAVQNVSLQSIPHPALGSVALATGDVYHFQWWHRDAIGGGLPTSNFTNALRVVVQ